MVAVVVPQDCAVKSRTPGMELANGQIMDVFSFLHKHVVGYLLEFLAGATLTNIHNILY